MKNLRLVIIACCMLTVYGLYSCKKDSSSPKKHTITYKLITNDYSFFTSVSYTDTIGVQEVVSAADSTSGWSKTINESYSGFNVLLQTQGQNSSTNGLAFSLEILVDGVSRVKQDFTTAAFGSFNNQVSAVIQ